jgi:hypothetical protein
LLQHGDEPQRDGSINSLKLNAILSQALATNANIATNYRTFEAIKMRLLMTSKAIDPCIQSHPDMILPITWNKLSMGQLVKRGDSHQHEHIYISQYAKRSPANLDLSQPLRLNH